MLGVRKKISANIGKQDPKWPLRDSDPDGGSDSDATVDEYIPARERRTIDHFRAIREAVAAAETYLQQREGELTAPDMRALLDGPLSMKALVDAPPRVSGVRVSALQPKKPDRQTRASNPKPPPRVSGLEKEKLSRKIS